MLFRSRYSGGKPLSASELSRLLKGSCEVAFLKPPRFSVSYCSYVVEFIERQGGAAAAPLKARLAAVRSKACSISPADCKVYAKAFKDPEFIQDSEAQCLHPRSVSLDLCPSKKKP